MDNLTECILSDMFCNMNKDNKIQSINKSKNNKFNIRFEKKRAIDKISIVKYQYNLMAKLRKIMHDIDFLFLERNFLKNF